VITGNGLDPGDPRSTYTSLLVVPKDIWPNFPYASDKVQSQH